MNKDGCEAVLSYLIQQLNIITQEMNINDESRTILANSLKQFYFSEILFNDAKNTFLSHENMKSNLSLPSQNECTQFQSSILSFPLISPMTIQNPTNHTINFVQKPFNSSCLMYSNHSPIVTSSLPTSTNQQMNINFNTQPYNCTNNMGTHDLLKILNRVSLLKMIDDTPIPAKTKPNDFSKKTRPWSLKEDNRLLGAIMRFGLDNWSRISKFVGNNRTRGQCSQRWSRGLNPSISRVEWSPQEDSLLLNYVKIHGNKKWSKISSLIGNRSDVQCRYRYKQLIKKRARSASDLNVSTDEQTDTSNNENTNINTDKNGKYNTTEIDDNYSYSEESNNDDKNTLKQDIPKVINQKQEFNSKNIYNEFGLKNMDKYIHNPNLNSQKISTINPIVNHHNINHINLMINKNKTQNFKNDKLIFPMPSSNLHKRVPSLKVEYDIDTFLSKFKE